MKINPIYRQESRGSARSFRLPLIVLGFNCVLAVAALLNMYSVIAQVRLTAELQYSSFLEMYVFVASVEFVLLLLLIPAITAGSISGERERQTLDLMLTTRVGAADIVFGKLLSGLSTVFLLIVSSFPILGLVFIYGGVTVADILLLLLCYVVTALFVGSMGIFCSAVSARSTVATVSAYCLTAAVCAGSVAVFVLSDSFTEMTSAPGSGGASWVGLLLLCNPAATFQAVLDGQLGPGYGLAAAFPWLETVLAGHGRLWWISGIVVQLLLSAAMLAGAVRSVAPRSSKKRGQRRLPPQGRNNFR